MQKIKIVTDSSCTMEKSTRDELNIHVIPLSVMVDGVVYADDDHLSGDQFLDMMKTAKELPKTSQPPIGEFVELYDSLGADGSKIISIHMTRALSGTVEAAHQASNMTKSDVTVVETGMIDQGLSFCVIRAAQMVLEEKSYDEIMLEIHQVLDHTRLFIGVSTLENLVKGGRISRAVGILSSILNIKVVMELRDSVLNPVVKGRGNKTFSKWFEELKEQLKTDNNVKQIGISYAGGYDQVVTYRDELSKIFPDMHIPLVATTPIVSTHSGNNAFAIMYYTED